MADNLQQENQEFDYEAFEKENGAVSFQDVMESNNESFLQEAGRHATRTGARAYEAVAGAPGNVESLVRAGGSFIGSKLGIKQKEKAPEVQVEKEDLIERGADGETADYMMQFYNGEATDTFLPTTADFKKFHEKISSKTIARDKTEETLDNVTSGIASLMTGGQGFIRAAGITIGSELLGEGAGLLTGREDVKDATKLGSMFLLSMVNPKQTVNQYKKLYKDAEKTIKSTDLAPATKFNQSMQSLKKELHKGSPTDPSKQETLTLIKEFTKKSEKHAGKFLKADELPAMNRSINERLTKIWELPGSIQKSSKRHLKQLQEALNESVTAYGVDNPKFLNDWKKANEVFGVHQQSNKAANFIRKHAPTKPLSQQTGVMLGAEHLFPKSTASIAGISSLATGIGTLGYRAFNSPAILSMYKKTLMSALKENVPQFTRNVKLLDKEVKKFEEKNK